VLQEKLKRIGNIIGKAGERLLGLQKDDSKGIVGLLSRMLYQK
jgi:hypothetical protein